MIDNDIEFMEVRAKYEALVADDVDKEDRQYLLTSMLEYLKKYPWALMYRSK